MSAPTNRFAAWWSTRSMLLKIIIINAAVFLTIAVTGIVARISGIGIDPVLRMLELPPSPAALLLKPWTLLTYMWVHYDVLHVLFNMLWLYWFGTIFLYSSTPKQLLALFIYGGVGGGVTYLATAAVLPAIAGGGLIGSSAAVMAIVIATAIIYPDFPVRLFFLGEVKLKWIAIATIVIFTIGLYGTNAGADVAHIGGAAVGVAYGICFRRGTDITRPFNRLIDSVVTLVTRPSARPPKVGPSQRRPDTRVSDDRAELDAILDKIKKSGYASLTADEKRRLFDVSKRV